MRRKARDLTFRLTSFVWLFESIRLRIGIRNCPGSRPSPANRRIQGTSWRKPMNPTQGSSRREWLASMSAAAGGMAFLTEAVAQDKNPAAQVADSTAGLKITALKTHLVQHKVYVEI